MKSNRRYLSFEKIRGDYPLAAFFNHIMSGMDFLRMMCAPVSFGNDDEDDMKEFRDKVFCDMCRYETWMHEVVRCLEMMQELTSTYFSEFNGLWRYYACSMRTTALRGEDMEMADVKVADDELRCYSVIDEIQSALGVFFAPTLGDISKMCSDILNNSRIDIVKGLKESLDAEVELYKIGEDGVARKSTVEEHELDEVSRQVRADDDVKRIMGIYGGVNGIRIILDECKWNEDNKESLQGIRDVAEYLLNMDFTKLSKRMHDLVDKKLLGEVKEEEGRHEENFHDGEDSH